MGCFMFYGFKAPAAVTKLMRKGEGAAHCFFMRSDGHYLRYSLGFDSFLGSVFGAGATIISKLKF